MAISIVPGEEPVLDNESGAVKVELEPGMMQDFSLDEFKDGKALLKIDGPEGDMIAELRANILTNTELAEGGGIQSFTLSLPSGYGILLPVPTVFSLHGFAMVWPQEEENGLKRLIREAVGRLDCNFSLRIGQDSVTFANGSAGKEYCSVSRAGSGGRGLLRPGRSGMYWKNETGKPGALIRRRINGGRPVYALTAREVGRCDKYPQANEDGIGVGIENGLMVVADGMGGGAFGECASSFVVDSMCNSCAGSIGRKALEAHLALYIFNRHLHMTNGKLSNAVMAAVQVDGDKFSAVSVGDARWVQVRNGKIINKSIIRSWVGERIRAGIMTQAEAMNSPGRSIVDTSMAYGFIPDLDSGTMEEGDIIMLFDDGLALTDPELLNLLAGGDQTLAEIGRHIAGMTKYRNRAGMDYFLVGGDEFAEAPAPRDNLGFILYRHEQPGGISARAGDEDAVREESDEKAEGAENVPEARVSGTRRKRYDVSGTRS